MAFDRVADMYMMRRNKASEIDLASEKTPMAIVWVSDSGGGDTLIGHKGIVHAVHQLIARLNGASWLTNWLLG